eukprot:2101260-Rhodomonas_salina.3
MPSTGTTSTGCDTAMESCTTRMRRAATWGLRSRLAWKPSVRVRMCAAHAVVCSACRQHRSTAHASMSAADAKTWSRVRLQAGFMFGAPREVLTPTTIEDGLTITTPRDADNIPDDNLQYWGQRNTNFQVGDGFAGGGR